MVGNPIGKCNLLWPVLSGRGTIRDQSNRSRYYMTRIEPRLGFHCDCTISALINLTIDSVQKIFMITSTVGISAY